MNESNRQEDRSDLTSEEVERRAIDAALNFLAYRQRTGREVHRKLASRGFSGQTVDAAMRRLNAVGLVDDEAYVAAYVRDRMTHRPMGVRRMIRELYLKGISREVADKVIEEVLQGENTDERALAERVVEKKRRTLSRAGEERVLRRRLRNHLIRRGFDGPVVRDVLDDVFSADDGSRDG